MTEDNHEFISRSEYKADIGGIHERIDQIFDILRRNKPHDLRTIVALACTLFVTVIFSLGSVMQIQLSSQADHCEKMMGIFQEANDESHKYLTALVEHNEEEIFKLRVRSEKILDKVPRHDEKIAAVEKMLDTKASDRFTGAEGRQHELRMERIEKELEKHGQHAP